MFWPSSLRRKVATPIDVAMMRHCIDLSRQAVSQGEWPFAAVVCRGGEIIAEAINRVARETDVSRHAETIAMSDAQRLLGSLLLEGCTLYTNVEPCVMCSWTVRMTRIPRVVFAIKSPIMGGYSGWNVLADAGLSAGCRSIFAVPPRWCPGCSSTRPSRCGRTGGPCCGS